MSDVDHSNSAAPAARAGDDPIPHPHGTGSDHTHPASSPAASADPVAIWQAEVAALRTLTHSVGVELRRRLIPLVRANLVTLDVACRILHSADLPELPRIWTVQLAVPVTARRTHATADQAITALRGDLHRAARTTLGQAATVDYPQPPTVSGTAGTDDGAHRYEICAQPTVTAPVRAQTRRHAQAAMIAALRAALVALLDVEADLDDPWVHVERDYSRPVELDVDTDAPYQPLAPLPAYGIGRHITEAQTTRRLAAQAWQYRVRRIRAALIDVLNDGDLADRHGRHGRHGPYGLVDDLLRELGLPGLPHAHLYEITATIPVTVTADNPVAARYAAHGLLCDAFASHPQYGLPITSSATFGEPVIVAASDGEYQVRWHETYLVCLRATHSPRLAEQAVRLQLGVLADALPDIATVSLTTAHLGAYIDHRLDPDRD